MANNVFPAFAYPIVLCGDRYDFSADELAWIDDLEMIENVGNRVSEDDRILDSEALGALRAFIDERILLYKRELLRIPDDNEIYITQSWANRAEPGQFHPRHRHQNSIISGVMYLDENAKGGLPPIRFHRAQELFPLDFAYDELNDFNATCKTFDPQRGMLILFPSLLEHDVEPNASETPRTSISFNTYARGRIGGKRQLTELDIS